MKKSEFVKLLKETVKSSINEISSDLFQRASYKANNLGQYNRASRMSNTFFNKFVGKQIMGGEIKAIEYRPNRGSDSLDIYLKAPYSNTSTGENRVKNIGGATYNIDSDEYKISLP
jgi:hypothetical protein